MTVNKILFIGLSNIGDSILTLPVLDALKEKFPQAGITVLTGPRPKEIFQGNPAIEKTIAYDKRSGLKQKIRLYLDLNKERFDLVVDLRNSFLGAILFARKKTSPLSIAPAGIKHMRDRHLYRIRDIAPAAGPKKSFYIGRDDRDYIEKILQENNAASSGRIIVVAPGAKSHTKRWPQEKFGELVRLLISRLGAKVILAGDRDDLRVSGYIAGNNSAVIDLSGRTNIRQLAALLEKAGLVITNDSAILHLASYLGLPLVAVFGPTDDAKYGPWSSRHAVAKKEIFCRPCQKAQCRFGTLDCLKLIRSEEVFRQAENILGSRPKPALKTPDFKRILVARTDRVGDVLLSTPVIKALRDYYPSSYIAMMVSPYARDIVEGNPYLDEVIVYDKDARHKGWLGSLRFAAKLRRKKFDLALVLHPANRAHLVVFLAGIARRIGYNRKMGFLLSDKLSHTKQLGEKHESEYSLDLVRYLGIEPEDKKPFMPLSAESEKWAEDVLSGYGISKGDKLLAVHPAASCPSKIWPNQSFAEVAERLSEKHGFKVIVVAGPKDIALAEQVIKNMRHPAINLAGKTSLSGLASILKRCRLFISNDSGPVHIASAVGTPVISIFGRNQKGLSPRRWGPLGAKDKVLHKEVGCIECLAHNCSKGFLCLKAISVEDVIHAAETILET